MTKNEIKLIVDFLEDLSDRMGNAGCNDFELENTPENYELILNAHNSEMDVKSETLNVVGNKILTFDFIMVSYLKNKLKKEYNV